MRWSGGFKITSLTFLGRDELSLLTGTPIHGWYNMLALPGWWSQGSQLSYTVPGFSQSKHTKKSKWFQPSLGNDTTSSYVHCLSWGCRDSKAKDIDPTFWNHHTYLPLRSQILFLIILLHTVSISIFLPSFIKNFSPYSASAISGSLQ